MAVSSLNLHTVGSSVFEGSGRTVKFNPDTIICSGRKLDIILSAIDLPYRA